MSLAFDGSTDSKLTPDRAMPGASLPATDHAAPVVEDHNRHRAPETSLATIGVFTSALTAACGGGTQESETLPPVAPVDAVPPILVGSIVVTDNTTGTSYTLAWPLGSDNVTVIAYEVSLDGGTSYASFGLALSANTVQIEQIQ